MQPLVTIGVPTFQRPELLRRALAAIASQDYENLEVVVADNSGADGSSAEHVVDAFSQAIPQLRYIRHSQNIGAIENFRFLLAQADGPYFMWLADDDEISPNYVSALVRLLESDPHAAAAAGHWILMRGEHDRQLVRPSAFPQVSPLRRVVRFVWHSDDAFFYGLHRATILRQASFPGYWWPNGAQIVNWAYVLLIDVVLRGKVLASPDESVQFINHEYTHKDHRLGRRSLAELFRRAMRRVNVHVLFWRKCATQMNARSLGLVAATSVASLLIEAARNLPRVVRSITVKKAAS